MFTTPCFIRKNTPELRKKLEEMGYINENCSTCNCIATSHASFTSIREELFDNKNPMITWDCAGRVDCGDNEQLFLALAAMRDDTDKDQLFTNGIDWTWYRDDTDKGGLAGFEFYYLQHYINAPLHKASKEEIMNCFQTPIA